MNNELLLITGESIPFIEAQIEIHQPTVSEISLIGEENFWAACQLINFSKNTLSEKDKTGLVNKSDFEIFMSIMCGNEQFEYRNSVTMLLALLFPEYNIRFTPNDIILIGNNSSTRINSYNYDIFKDIINSMFDLGDSDLIDKDYNPVDARAAKIAEKLRKHKEKIAKQKGENPDKVAILSRYVSILAVGQQRDMNSYKLYTVFQLKDEFKRYQMKQSYDMYISAKLAGAQDLDEVDNWMDNIHS